MWIHGLIKQDYLPLVILLEKTEHNYANAAEKK